MSKEVRAFRRVSISEIDPCDEEEAPEEPYIDEDFMERHFADFFNLYSDPSSTVIRFGWRQTRHENARYTQETRMPTPISKLLATLLRMRLKRDEIAGKYTISLPPAVLEAYGIDRMEWENLWADDGEAPRR